MRENSCEENLGYVKALGQDVLKHGHSYIIGGDFNIPLTQFLENVDLIQLDSRVQADDAIPTYKSGPHESYLDYFVVSRSFLPFVSSVAVVDHIDLPTHKPVLLRTDFGSPGQMVVTWRPPPRRTQPPPAARHTTRRDAHPRGFVRVRCPPRRPRRDPPRRDTRGRSPRS